MIRQRIYGGVCKSGSLKQTTCYINIYHKDANVVFDKGSIQKKEKIKPAFQTPHFEGVTSPEGCADASPSSEIDIPLFAKAIMWLK